MNVFKRSPKNFEALFLVAAIGATFATYAAADVPVVASRAPAIVKTVEAAPAMQVVVIKGQRLTAAQKAAL